MIFSAGIGKNTCYSFSLLSLDVDDFLAGLLYEVQPFNHLAEADLWTAVAWV